MNFIAALLLLHMPEERAFWVLAVMITSHCIASHPIFSAPHCDSSTACAAQTLTHPFPLQSTPLHSTPTVPQGFIITTEAYKDYIASQATRLEEFQPPIALSQSLVSQYTVAIKELEKQTGRLFGAIHLGNESGMITSAKDIGNTIPLLLSVRSGGPVYVPGMAETVLSLGLNDNLCEVMGKLSKNPHWAFENYRCFIQVSRGEQEQLAYHFVTRFT
jgi:hypothetical protein